MSHTISKQKNTVKKSEATLTVDPLDVITHQLNYFSSDTSKIAKRKKRSLNAPIPTTFPIITDDKVNIQLTRYQGGKKGPVILAHGLGVSSEIFSTDMIKTNLVEYLTSHKYDVWLLDFRVSIALPASQEQSTADQIGKYDYPAAINKVLEVTKEKNVQMVVHCFGATAWTIGILAGHIKNVRSAVVSQVSIHTKVATLSKLKTGFYLPEFLDKIGVDSLTSYTSKEADWENKLFDKLLKLYPIQKEEQCLNPVCRRITFLYGQLYEHDQLNETTHNNLHELYGITNITSFEHLAEIVRQGHVVTASGDDVYIAHLDRMKLPITFIGGAENECFLPEGLEQTYQTLKQHNGDKWYKKHSIPNYGHIDCIHGKNASQDVYPHILAGLEEQKIDNSNDLPKLLKAIQETENQNNPILLSQYEQALISSHHKMLEAALIKNIQSGFLSRIGFGDLAWILHLNNDYKDIHQHLSLLDSLTPEPNEKLLAQRPNWPEKFNPEKNKMSQLWNPLSWNNLAVSVSNKLHIPNHKPSEIFARIQDASNWNKYYANGSEVSTDKLTHQGQLFSFKTFNTIFDAELIIFQNKNSDNVLSIAWKATSGKLLKTEVVHRWDIYPDGKQGSIVTTEETQRGIKPALTAKTLYDAMRITHQNWLYGHAVSAKNITEM